MGKKNVIRYKIKREGDDEIRGHGRYVIRFSNHERSLFSRLYTPFSFPSIFPFSIDMKKKYVRLLRKSVSIFHEITLYSSYQWGTPDE